MIEGTGWGDGGHRDEPLIRLRHLLPSAGGEKEEARTRSFSPRRAGEKVPKADEGLPYGRIRKYNPYRAAS